MSHSSRSYNIGRRICLLVLVATIAAIPLISGCGGNAQQQKIVKIGVLAPLTGPASADGEEYVRGAKIAVNEINAAGGVKGNKFEIITGDTKDMTPDAAVSAIEKLRSDPDLGCIVTGYATMSNFEIDKMAEMQIPYLLSANTEQTRDIIQKDPSKYPTVWSIQPSYDAYGTELPKVLEKWASEGKIDLGDKEVALITSDNPYSMSCYEGLKENLLKGGWRVTLDEMVPFTDVHDWRAILAKVRQRPPNLLINTDFLSANAAMFMNQFMEDPTNSLVFIQYAPSVPEFVELTKQNCTGVLYNILGDLIRSPKHPATAEFLEKFKKEYGVDSGMYGPSLYYEVYVYADALEKVGDPKDYLAIGKAIGETKDKVIHSGRLEFDPKTHLGVQGDDHLPIQFFQLWEGERVLVRPEKYATGEFRLPPWMKK